MTNKSRRNYIRALSQQVNRKKMYKAKKQWVVAGIGFLVATGISAVGGMNTHADTVANSQQTTVQSNNSKVNNNASHNHVQIANQANSQNSNNISDPISTSASNLHNQIMANNIQRQSQSSSVNTNVHVQNQDFNARVGNLDKSKLNNNVNANHSTLHQVYQHGLSKLASMNLSASNQDQNEYGVPSGVIATKSNNGTTLTVSGDFSNHVAGKSLDPDNNINDFGTVTTLNLNDIHLGSKKTPFDASNLFSGMKSLTTVNVLHNVDTSNVDNMSKMFANDPKLQNINGLSNFNTERVTSIADIFNGDSDLKDITPLKHWVLTNVTDMSGAFEGTIVSDTTPIKNWDTTNIAYGAEPDDLKDNKVNIIYSGLSNMFANDRYLHSDGAQPIITHWSFSNDNYKTHVLEVNPKSSSDAYKPINQSYAPGMFSQTEISKDQGSPSINVSNKYDYFTSNPNPSTTQADNVTISLRFVNLSDQPVAYNYNSDLTKAKLMKVVHPNSIITVDNNIFRQPPQSSGGHAYYNDSITGSSVSSLASNEVNMNLINNTIDKISYTSTVSSKSKEFPLEPASDLTTLDSALCSQVPSGYNIFDVPTLDNGTYTVGTNSDNNDYNIQVALVSSDVDYGRWGNNPSDAPFTYDPNSDNKAFNIYSGEISDPYDHHANRSSSVDINTVSPASIGMNYFLKSISSNSISERVRSISASSSSSNSSSSNSSSASSSSTTYVPALPNAGDIHAIAFHSNVSAPANARYLFASMSDLTVFNSNSGNLDTSDVSDMSDMLQNDKNLNDITELSGWNTANVTNMSGLFSGDSNLLSTNNEALMPLANWNVLNVSNITNMFTGTYATPSGNSNSISESANQLASDFEPITENWVFNPKGSSASISGDSSTGIYYYSNTSKSTSSGSTIYSAVPVSSLVSQPQNSTNYQYGSIYTFPNTKNYREVPITYNFGSTAVASNTSSHIITLGNKAILPAAKNLSDINSDVVSDADGNRFKFSIPQDEEITLNNDGGFAINVNLIASLDNSNDYSPDNNKGKNCVEELTPDGTLIVSGRLPNNISLSHVLNGYRSDVKSIDVSNAIADGDLSHVFSGFKNLKDITGLAALNTNNVSKLDYAFQSDTSLSDVSPIAQWNVENVASLNGMFKGDSSLKDASPIINDWFFLGQPSQLSDTDMLSGTGAVSKYSVTPKLTENKNTNNAQFADAPADSNRVTINMKFGSDTVGSPYVRDLGNSKSAVIPSTSIPFPSDYGLPAENITISGSNSSDDIQVDKTGKDGTATYYLSDGGTLSFYNGTLSDNANINSQNGIGSNTKVIKFNNVSAPKDANGLFEGMSDLKSVGDGLDISNTSDLTNMFKDDKALSDLSALAHWDPKNVTKLGGMFSQDSQLTPSDFRVLSSWKFKNDPAVSTSDGSYMLSDANTNNIWANQVPYFDNEGNPENYKDAPYLPVPYADGMYGFDVKEPISNQVTTKVSYYAYSSDNGVPTASTKQLGLTQQVTGIKGNNIDIDTLPGIPAGYSIIPTEYTTPIRYQEQPISIGVIPDTDVLDVIEFQENNKQVGSLTPWLAKKHTSDVLPTNLVPSGYTLTDPNHKYVIGNNSNKFVIAVTGNGSSSNTNNGSNNNGSNSNNSNTGANTNNNSNNNANTTNNSSNNTPNTQQSDMTVNIHYVDGNSDVATIPETETVGSTFNTVNYVPSDYVLSKTVTGQSDSDSRVAQLNSPDVYVDVVPQGSVSITYMLNGQPYGATSIIEANSGDYGTPVQSDEFTVPEGFKLANDPSNHITFDGMPHNIIIVSDNSTSDITPTNTSNTTGTTNTNKSDSGIINMTPSTTKHHRHHSSNYSDSYKPLSDNTDYDDKGYHKMHSHKHSHHYSYGRTRRVRSLRALNRIGVGQSAYYNGFKVTRRSNRAKYLNVTRTIRMYSNVTLKHKSRFLTVGRTRRHPVKVLRVFKTRKGIRYEIKVGRRRYFIARRHTYIAYYHSLRGHHTARVLRAITVFKTKHLTHRAKRLYHGRKVHVQGITRVGHRPVFRIGHNRYVLADKAFLKLI